MTTQKTFKRRVRDRMDRTGESYTAARRQLIAKAPAPEPVAAQNVPRESVVAATGRPTEEWFAALDAWGATERTHTEIARWLGAEHGVPGWWCQNIAVAYEQARGLRKPGQRASGYFEISASRTVAVPVERLYEAVADAELRERWLPGSSFEIRKATPHRSIRANWVGGAERVNVGFEARGDTKSTVFVGHERLEDEAAMAAAKAYWRERLGALKELLED